MLWRVETSVTFPPLPPAAPIGSVHPTTCRSRSPVRLIRHSVRALGCALVLLATGRAPAQGGPPLVTDDPGRPGRGTPEGHGAAPVGVTGGAGRVFESGGVGDWVWGVALGHSFGRVEALAEVFSTHGDDAVSRQSLVNLGGRVLVSAGSTLPVSRGWGPSRRGRAPHACPCL